MKETSQAADDVLCNSMSRRLVVQRRSPQQRRSHTTIIRCPAAEQRRQSQRQTNAHTDRQTDRQRKLCLCVGYDACGVLTTIITGSALSPAPRHCQRSIEFHHGRRLSTFIKSTRQSARHAALVAGPRQLLAVSQHITSHCEMEWYVWNKAAGT